MGNQVNELDQTAAAITLVGLNVLVIGANMKLQVTSIRVKEGSQE